MAREKKPVELKTVEEHAPDDTEIIRLGGTVPTVRVLPEMRDPRPAPAARLEVPVADLTDGRRSHEPGIEALEEMEVVVPTDNEEVWGQTTTAKMPIPWGWFALLTLAIAGAATWSFTHINKAEVVIEEEQAQISTLRKQEEQTDRELGLMINNMEQAAKAFCTARSVKDLLPWVRHPERVRPLIESHLVSHSEPPPGFDRMRSPGGVSLDGEANFWILPVVVADRSVKNLLAEVFPDGQVRIDWETAVVYQPMPWDEFARNRPQDVSLDFRVYAEPDRFFSHEFANESQWESFRLTAINSEETLFGYATRNGKIATELRTLANTSKKQQAQVILRLMLPQGLLSRRGVVIEKIVSPRWVLLKEPQP